MTRLTDDEIEAMPDTIWAWHWNPRAPGGGGLLLDVRRQENSTEYVKADSRPAITWTKGPPPESAREAKQVLVLLRGCSHASTTRWDRHTNGWLLGGRSVGSIDHVIAHAIINTPEVEG